MFNIFIENYHQLVSFSQLSEAQFQIFAVLVYSHYNPQCHCWTQEATVSSEKPPVHYLPKEKHLAIISLLSQR